jgi:hypothetical protein
MDSSYGLVTVFRAGEPGEVPALLLHLNLSIQLPLISGTEGPKQHCTFQIAPVSDRRFYRVKLSARRVASRVLPRVTMTLARRA